MGGGVGRWGGGDTGHTVEVKFYEEYGKRVSIVVVANSIPTRSAYNGQNKDSALSETKMKKEVLSWLRSSLSITTIDSQPKPNPKVE